MLSREGLVGDGRVAWSGVGAERGCSGDAPFGRGHVAATVLGRVIDGAVAIGCRLPCRLAHGLAGFGGHIEWAARRRLRVRLAENLARAVDASAGDRSVRRCVRREIINEAHRSADLLWAIGRPDAFLATTDVVGVDHVRRALGRGRGLLLVGIHLGGWEVATPVPAAVVPVPTTVITADDWLAWAIDHRRRAVGLTTVRADRTIEQLRVLRRGECLLVLGDHALDGRTRTYPVELCGHPAHLPAGVVVLARLAQAPIVTFDVVPVARRQWRVTIGALLDPPADVDDEREVLQHLADRWTAVIRAHPCLWSARFPIAWAAPSA